MCLCRCVCVCVCRCVCVCVCVCVRTHAGVYVYVGFCLVQMGVYLYASWCMSVLSFASGLYAYHSSRPFPCKTSWIKNLNLPSIRSWAGYKGDHSSKAHPPSSCAARLCPRGLLAPFSQAPRLRQPGPPSSPLLRTRWRKGGWPSAASPPSVAATTKSSMKQTWSLGMGELQARMLSELLKQTAELKMNLMMLV